MKRATLLHVKAHTLAFLACVGSTADMTIRRMAALRRLSLTALKPEEKR